MVVEFCSYLFRIYIFLIPVLQLLKSAQMQHGLRHGDYTRYRYMSSNFILGFDQLVIFKFHSKLLIHIHNEMSLLLLLLISSFVYLYYCNCWSERL